LLLKIGVPKRHKWVVETRGKLNPINKSSEKEKNHKINYNLNTSKFIQITMCSSIAVTHPEEKHLFTVGSNELIIQNG